MLCPRCREHPDASPDNRQTPPPGRNGLEERARCDRCGTPVAADRVPEPLLAKLAQLARFGLAADGGPLLEPLEKGD